MCRCNIFDGFENCKTFDLSVVLRSGSLGDKVSRFSTHLERNVIDFLKQGERGLLFEKNNNLSVVKYSILEIIV